VKLLTDLTMTESALCDKNRSCEPLRYSTLGMIFRVPPVFDRLGGADAKWSNFSWSFINGQAVAASGGRKETLLRRGGQLRGVGRCGLWRLEVIRVNPLTLTRSKTDQTQPSFVGELGWPNYGPTQLGRSVYGPYPSFWCSRGVSVSV